MRDLNKIKNNQCVFLDKEGTFKLEYADSYTGLYFPLGGEAGLKSAVTPSLNGDAKLDQNHFLLEPTSIENLHNNRSSRNFWVLREGMKPWSLTGISVWQQALMEDKVTVEAGILFHKMTREAADGTIKASITSYVPVNDNTEVHMVEITNTDSKDAEYTFVTAAPIYGRSADNLRDHRHVTSLLHRVYVKNGKVIVNPTLSFDERGHQLNDTLYYVTGTDAKGNTASEFFPDTNAFLGEGGSFERPVSLIENASGVKEGFTVNGVEAMGGLKFSSVTVKAGETVKYVVLMGLTTDEKEADSVSAKYSTFEKAEAGLKEVKEYWKKKINVLYETGDVNFDGFMRWVSFQPEVRRLFGCSFLPHHDYGRGGRGWRDLWQDCLALLIMNPDGVRDMLLSNYEGVRIDGSNATIIGNKLGEFKADRNGITRVWMDHGVWPLITTKLYIDQTGDLNILTKEVPYYKDRQVMRGLAIDNEWDGESLREKDPNGNTYKGTILEHLLIQNLTAFWEVGEHNVLRLRDADWNDALDMAGKRGESVAFSNAYAKNLADIADLLECLHKENVTKVNLLKETSELLKTGDDLYENIVAKNKLLDAYCGSVKHHVSGETIEVETLALADTLRKDAEWLREHLRKREWVKDSKGNGWFNGYYDDNGRALDGERDGRVNMTLTGQVFSVMGGTATKEQVKSIAKAADTYLYDEAAGGYRLNTDFKEIKTDMGRMFGFAFGEKENGAVFSHMTTMFANALYQRGFAKEGYKALGTLYRQSADFNKGHIYPGIPEYFGKGGRGLYHYLTGAASWYMMTVVNQMFGVRGDLGTLIFEPKLLKEQFDEKGIASIELTFAKTTFKVNYVNVNKLDFGEYKVKEAVLDGAESLPVDTIKASLCKDKIQKLGKDKVHVIDITLC